MGTTILIVDDDPDVRLAVRTVCELEGFEVVGEAADGNEAIAMVQTLSPQVVVLDYMMPNMNGELAAGVIRAVAPDSRILAFSAIIRSQPPWSDAYLDKNDIDRLPEALKSLMAP